MAARNRARAKRRNLARSRRDALVLQAVADVGQAPPQERRVPHKSQLEFLLGRGSISPAQFAAGDRLACDYRIAGEAIGHLVARYEGAPRSAPGQAGIGRREGEVRRGTIGCRAMALAHPGAP